jgi:hypothetical protein
MDKYLALSKQKVKLSKVPVRIYKSSYLVSLQLKDRLNLNQIN